MTRRCAERRGPAWRRSGTEHDSRHVDPPGRREGIRGLAALHFVP
jgi:hypothetical protein